jgi:hypothetical protein
MKADPGREEIMQDYHIVGLTDEFAAEVRRTMRSPEYGHPAVREVATGTGPCRVCLRRFEVGLDERILFTYRSVVDEDTVGAPGPVFIHANACARYQDTRFPEDLYTLPVILEGRAPGNRVPRAVTVDGAQADGAIAELLAHPEVEYVHVRHGVAGCHIARVNRGPLP